METQRKYTITRCKQPTRERAADDIGQDKTFWIWQDSDSQPHTLAADIIPTELMRMLKRRVEYLYWFYLRMILLIHASWLDCYQTRIKNCNQSMFLLLWWIAEEFYFIHHYNYRWQWWWWFFVLLRQNLLLLLLLLLLLFFCFFLPALSSFRMLLLHLHINPQF